MKSVHYLLMGLLTILVISCHKDLEQNPIDPDLFTEVDVYNNAEQARGALAKLYASFAVTGQQGPTGSPDLDESIISEGFSQYTRILFSLNELTTDTAVIGWSDSGLPNFHELSWSADNPWTRGMYFRLAQAVSFSNSFIENAATLSDNSEVAEYIAEARFLRAYAYYQLMDLFANVPISTTVTADLPEQSSRAEVFAFIEAELTEIQDLLPTAQSVEYGRVDQVAAWALLSRMYLNAEVFTGTAQYDNAVVFSDRVLESAYSLNTSDGNNNGSAYDELFLADNDTNGAQNEFIYAIQFDGITTTTWGGATFMVHAPICGEMNNFAGSVFGVNGGWNGIRTTKGLVDKFAYSITASDADDHPTAWSDSRAMFFTDGQNYEIDRIPKSSEGYGITKYRNVDIYGNPGKDSSGNHADVDLPVLRVAEIHLNYAEAVLRGGAGDISRATTLINGLRSRAGAATINSGDLTLDFVMDERARELYWEGLRRTDLVRDGKFVSGSYLWPFKAGAASGAASEEYRKIFPLPEDVLLVNSNLTQNPNY